MFRSFRIHLLLITIIHSNEAHDYISNYAVTYFQNGFIIFGGIVDNVPSKTIARLDLATTSWSKLGDLQTGRREHGVIYDGDVFLIIGGWGDYKTERCSLSGKEFYLSLNSNLPMQFIIRKKLFL